jgi:tight adherence protein B
MVGPAAARQTQPELRIESIDATSFPIISVLVTPPPELFGFAPDPASIRVLESGVERPATVRLLTDQPLEVLLAIDTSGSMRGEPLTSAVAAASSFLEQMPPTTRTAVMGFATTPALLSEFSEDPEIALAALQTLEATGETALYDAVAAALDAFDTASRTRRFLILLSDGGDTASAATLEDTAARLEASDIGFYAVELQTAESDPESLDTLASVSAGRVAPAADPTALASIYGSIASELANQLAVSYTTVRGGEVQLSITIRDGGISASATEEIILPIFLVPTTTTMAPTTTAAPTTIATTTTTTFPSVAAPLPPTAFEASPPGPLSGTTAKWVGISLFAVAAILVFSMALVPAGRQSRPLQGVRGRFAPAGGWLTRLSRSAERAAERALSRGGRQSPLSRSLDSAGIGLAAGEFVVLSVSAAIIGFAVGLAIFGLLGAFLLGILAGVIPRLVVAHRKEKRKTDFADQLEGTLQLVAGSLRAGYGLLQALNTVANESASPTKEEFQRVMVETRLGRDLIESLHAMADRFDNQDFRWIVQAIDIQRSVGGDLAAILDTVAQTIRERNQIRRQIRALSAEGRISAYILIALPFLIASFILIVAPDFLRPLVDTVPGRIAVGVAAVLMATGIIWIRRLIRLVF